MNLAAVSCPVQKLRSDKCSGEGSCLGEQKCCNNGCYKECTDPGRQMKIYLQIWRDNFEFKYEMCIEKDKVFDKTKRYNRLVVTSKLLIKIFPN